MALVSEHALMISGSLDTLHALVGTISVEHLAPTSQLARVWAPPPIADDAPPATGLEALISGTVSYDDVNDCFLIEDTTGTRYPVVWPAGTTAAPTGIGVVLSDGRTVHAGDHVSGGGGYLRVAAEWKIPAECSALSDGQVAVFNAAFPLDL